MCRYSFYNYKNTYGCFTCQMGFKRRNLKDVQPEVFEEINAKAREIQANTHAFVAQVHDFKCPNCGGNMANLGRDLRLPVKTKDEQWRCIKYLIDNKYNVYSCGCQGIGFVPHKMTDAVTLVAEYKKKQKSNQKEYDVALKFQQKAKEKAKRDTERNVKKEVEALTKVKK